MVGVFEGPKQPIVAFSGRRRKGEGISNIERGMSIFEGRRARVPAAGGIRPAKLAIQSLLAVSFFALQSHFLALAARPHLGQTYFG